MSASFSNQSSAARAGAPRAPRRPLGRLRLVAGLVVALDVAACVANAATITIVSRDEAGEGFNDPTPVAPVGGNPGTTLGAQRYNVFVRAAEIWGALLPSDVEIRVDARMDPLSCTPTSAVLGTASPTWVRRDFAGAPFPGTWYVGALANKLAGVDLLSGVPEISAQFNSNFGLPGCGSAWYYGFDGEGGGQIEMLSVLLHEFAHGLGFWSIVSPTTGAFPEGFPGVFERFVLDDGTGEHWSEMTDAERLASAQNCGKVVWDGASTTAASPGRLTLPTPLLRVNHPPAIAGDLLVGTATFGTPLSASGVTADLVVAQDGVGSTSDACEPLTNAAALAGKIALVDRGVCAFSFKVAACQAAGAVGVVVVDNAAGCPPPGMGGTDPSIVISSARVSLADGLALKAQLASGGVNATLISDPAVPLGADAAGRVKLFASQPGGVVGIRHWDPSATPDLLMEAAIASDPSTDVDLTYNVMVDIGWLEGSTAVDASDPRTRPRLIGFPNPASAATVRFTLARDERAELSVYDLAGRRVRLLVNEPLVAGEHAVRWDGTGSNGARIPAGVYRYRLKTDSFEETRSVVLVR